jgi:hypothetical protein
MSKTNRAQNNWWPVFTRIWLASVLALLLAPQAARAAADKPTVAPVQNLDFGAFVVLPSCVNCSITMNPDGSRTATPGIILSSKSSGRPAQFSVGCNNPSCTNTVSVSTSVSMAAGGVTMTVGSFTTSKRPATTPSVLSVGGKLTIPQSGSAVGTYTSTSFMVTTT